MDDVAATKDAFLRLTIALAHLDAEHVDALARQALNCAAGIFDQVSRIRAVDVAGLTVADEQDEAPVGRLLRQPRAGFAQGRAQSGRKTRLNPC